MSKWLRVLLGIQVIAGVAAGAPLLAAPGRFLDWLGWAPIDPVMSRLAGAALLAATWVVYRVRRSGERSQLRVALEMLAIFDLLSAAGLLRQVTKGHWPVAMWILAGLFLAFGVAWAAAWNGLRAGAEAGSTGPRAV